MLRRNGCALATAVAGHLFAWRNLAAYGRCPPATAEGAAAREHQERTSRKYLSRGYFRTEARSFAFPSLDLTFLAIILARLAWKRWRSSDSSRFDGTATCNSCRICPGPARNRAVTASGSICACPSSGTIWLPMRQGRADTQSLCTGLSRRSQPDLLAPNYVDVAHVTVRD